MNKHGQSMIEYALIAVLVIFGIVIMGPYVLRSVGGHFKLWDEGVRDSFTENLTQAPISNMPNMPVICKCAADSYVCGGGTCTPSQQQVSHNTNCNPPGCGDATKSVSCVDAEAACCSPWAYSCGSMPCTKACSSEPTVPVQSIIELLEGKYDCYLGQKLQTRKCGKTTDNICTIDLQTCPLPTCQGDLTQGYLYCETKSITPPTDLTAKTDISYPTPPTCPGNLPPLAPKTTIPYPETICGSTCTGNSPCEAYASCSVTMAYQTASSSGGSPHTVTTTTDNRSEKWCFPSSVTVTSVSNTTAGCGSTGSPSKKCYPIFYLNCTGTGAGDNSTCTTCSSPTTDATETASPVVCKSCVTTGPGTGCCPTYTPAPYCIVGQNGISDGCGGKHPES